MEEAGDAEEKSSLEPTPNNMYVGGTPVSAAHHQHHTHKLGAVNKDLQQAWNINDSIVN